MIFDIVVLIILLVSCVTAFLRGFIREVLTICGVVGGTLAAFFLSPSTAPYIQAWLGADKGEKAEKIFGILPPDLAGSLLSYGGTFAIVVVILSFVSHKLAQGARALGLGAVDRSLGVLFGMVRAVLLLSLLYLIPFVLAPRDVRDKFLAGSKTQPMLEITTGWVASFLPGTAKAAPDEKEGSLMEQMKKTTREKLQDIDVLEKKTDSVPSDTGEGEGYKDGQRQDMKSLIDDNLNN